MDGLINRTKINSTDILNVTFARLDDTEPCRNLLFQYLGLTIFLMTLYAIVMIIGLVGNVFIIYIVITKKYLRTSTNLFLVNIAVCGIGIVCFMIPKKVSEVFTGQWVWLVDGNIGRALCKLVPFIHDVFTDCSTYSLLLITHDRFCAVVLPHKRWLTSRIVSTLIGLTWAGSAIVNCVSLKTFDLKVIKSRLYCIPLWSSIDESLAYLYAIITLNIVLPMVIIPLAYLMIFRKLKNQSRILSQSISEQQQNQESLRQRKIVYMAVAIVCCFAICWIPFAVQVIISTIYLRRTTLPCHFLRYREVSYYFLVLISVTNPVICFTFHFNFREQLRLLFQRVCCRMRVSDLDNSSTSKVEINKTDERKEGRRKVNAHAKGSYRETSQKWLP